MPIDPVKALAAPPVTTTGAWNADAVILYHLGVGAGGGPGKAIDPDELRYTYERDLKVLPTFAVIPGMGTVVDLNSFPGIDVDFAHVLHGEQETEIHGVIPTGAEVEHETRVVGVYDKGQAALIVVEVATRDGAGAPLFTNRSSIFVRGEGGFGGEAGPRSGLAPPDRAPDAVVPTPTTEHQALLYRLSGDMNPLHADPRFAARGGFERPILHGLCTYGIACKATVDEVLGGDVEAVRHYRARFAGIVFPGETIETSMWREDGQVVLTARTVERGEPVLTNAAITFEE